MSNRFTLILGVVAGVILVLAINAFAHRAHELRGAPGQEETEAARLAGPLAPFRSRIDGATAGNHR
jgi:hypothetical protein